MKGAILALAASALLSSVHGHERRHAHEDFHKKRYLAAPTGTVNDTCTTIYSTWYGEPTLVYEAPPPPPVVPSTTPCTTSTTSTTTPCTTSTSSTSTYVAATSAAPAPPKYSAPAPAAPATYAPAAPASGGNWAMTYTPYTTGPCKGASQVDADIAKIAGMGFSAVRLYNTDCGQVANVAAACKKHGLKMIMGLWITGPSMGAVESQLSIIKSYFNGDYSIVELVLVGNEVLANTNYGVSAGQLAGMISSVKSALKADGYTGPVSTTDVPAKVLGNANILCPVIDDVCANIHPFFDANTSAAGAGAYVSSTLAKLTAMCGGSRTARNTETGWPTAGQTNGLAVPGFAQQKIAVLSIKESCGGQSTFFSFTNDLWKAPGEFAVEQSWGLNSIYDLL